MRGGFRLALGHGARERDAAQQRGAAQHGDGLLQKLTTGLKHDSFLQFFVISTSTDAENGMAPIVQNSEILIKFFKHIIPRFYDLSMVFNKMSRST